MTLKEQLLRELEQAPENLLQDLWNFYQATKAEHAIRLDQDEQPDSERVTAQKVAVQRLQVKMRATILPGRSLVDELIVEHRTEALNE
jgi:hypothetical protein